MEWVCRKRLTILCRDKLRHPVAKTHTETLWVQNCWRDFCTETESPASRVGSDNRCLMHCCKVIQKWKLSWRRIHKKQQRLIGRDLSELGGVVGRPLRNIVWDWHSTSSTECPCVRLRRPVWQSFRLEHRVYIDLDYEMHQSLDSHYHQWFQRDNN